MQKLFLSLFIIFLNIYLAAQDPGKPVGTLPVELVYFYGNDSTEISSVVLIWGTATEVNCYGFDIEMSVDSVNFHWLGFVMGNGNSNSPKEYSFQDSLIVNSGIYYYRLKQIDTDGAFKYSAVIKIDYQLTYVLNNNKRKYNFSLEQNYPNPFNPTTTISFEIDDDKEISLDVFDTEGKFIMNLITGKLHSGKYHIQLDGNYLATGVYFCRLNSGTMSVTRKLLLLK